MADPNREDPMSIIEIEIPNDPFVGWNEPLNNLDEHHISTFYDRNNLPLEKKVFIRGVLAYRHREQILGKFDEIADGRPAQKGSNNKKAKKDYKSWGHLIQMSIGDHRYTSLESEVIHNAWTRDWKDTFVNLARLHRLLIVACIYAAMTQGWDQAAMAGAAIEVMKDLGRPTITGPSSNSTQSANNSDFSIDLDHNTWLLGITVGVPFFAGAILGLIITDPITSVLGFGRRGAICVAGAFSFISVIGSASVNKWEHLLGFRILLGAGMAGKASIVPILLSETSPRNIRGMLLVFWQLFVAFGLAAGSVANLSVYRLDVNSSWRYMFISAFIPALLLLSLILFSPESPRWLLKESGAEKGRPDNDPCRQDLVRQAFKSLLDLRGEPSPILAAGELYLMHARLIDEQRRLKAARPGHPSSNDAPRGESESRNRFLEVVDHIGWGPRVELMFFRSGFTRRAHMAAAAVMISQQLCGINLIAFLADTFFRYSFFHHNHDPTPHQNVQLLGASLGLMLLNFLATIPALFIMDRTNGRRRSLNWSFPCMALSLLGSALVLKSPSNEDGQPTLGTIIGHYVFLVTFIIAYSMGEGPAAFVISAEVFPLVNRELGMSLAVFWNFMGAGLLAVAAPWLLKVLGQFGVLLLFAGLNMVAWFLCFWLVPPTGNEDLEAVYEKLEVPLWNMLGYICLVVLWRTTQVLEFGWPFIFKKWDDCGADMKRTVEGYKADMQQLTRHGQRPNARNRSAFEDIEMNPRQGHA